MTIEADNVAVLRRAYELWRTNQGRAFDSWMDLMAEDVDWGSLADGAPGMTFTAHRRSKAELRRYFEGLAQDWEMIDYAADQFIAQGEHVVMRGRCSWRHRRTGKEIHSPKADFFRMKNGKVVEFYEFYDTAGALAATR